MFRRSANAYLVWPVVFALFAGELSPLAASRDAAPRTVALDGPLMNTQAMALRAIYTHSWAVSLFSGLIHFFESLGDSAPEARQEGLSNMDDQEAHRWIERAIVGGLAVAIDLNQPADYYLGADVTADMRLERLTAGLFDMPADGLDALRKELENPENVEALRRGIPLLQEAAAQSPRRESLLAHRYVIALEDNVPFTSGLITAYQGHAGDKNKSSIYLSTELLDFVSTDRAPAGALERVLEHEDHHLAGNPAPEFIHHSHHYSSQEEFELTSVVQREFAQFQQERLRRPVTGLSWYGMVRRVMSLAFAGIISETAFAISGARADDQLLKALIFHPNQTMQILVNSAQTLHSMISPFTLYDVTFNVQLDEEKAPLGQALIDVVLPENAPPRPDPAPFFADDVQADTEMRRKMLEPYKKAPVFLSRESVRLAEETFLELFPFFRPRPELTGAMALAQARLAAVNLKADQDPLIMEDLIPLLEQLMSFAMQLGRWVAEEFVRRYNERFQEIMQGLDDYLAGPVGEIQRIYAENKRIEVEEMRAMFEKSLEDSNPLSVFHHAQAYLEVLDKGRHRALLVRVLSPLQLVLSLAERLRSCLPLQQSYSVKGPDRSRYRVVGFIGPSGEAFAASSFLNIFHSLETGAPFDLFRMADETIHVRGVVASEINFQADPASLLEVHELMLGKPSLRNTVGSTEKPVLINSPGYGVIMRKKFENIAAALFGSAATANRILEELGLHRGKTAVFLEARLLDLLPQLGIHAILLDSPGSETADAVYNDEGFAITAGAFGTRMSVIDSEWNDPRFWLYTRHFGLDAVVSLEHDLDPATLARWHPGRQPLAIYVANQGPWNTYEERLSAAGWNIDRSVAVETPDSHHKKVGRIYHLSRVEGASIPVLDRRLVNPTRSHRPRTRPNVVMRALFASA